ncbi:MAG: hypothetical protein DRP10_00210 [Candidatus Aenigmatarchaeota archaeon]|nr:MAG: hypothetical protein DRP10_00210 [Candidatus Aenigmarchaeota archaeon]
MKFPFSHREEEISSIPTEEVKKLRESGKSDREIINELKNKGYSFQAIERAMLQALKYGVSSKRETPTQSKERDYNQRKFEFEPSEQKYELPTREELTPKPILTLPPRQEGLEMESGPVDLIEEVVEGVVEEKFEKLDTKFEFINKEHKKLKEDIEGLKALFVSSIQKRDKEIEEIRNEIEKLKENIEEVVIKYNALERAFKQFLPDLIEKNREKKVVDLEK